MSRRSRRRILDPEERALWDHVSRSVQPLRPVRAVAPEPPPAAPLPPPDPGPSEPKPGPRARRAPPGAPLRPLAPPAPPPLAALEPKVRRRLNRGAEVDARLDLHGLTQAAAHHRLRLFVMEAQAMGHTLVLVITGKGAREDQNLGAWRGGLEGGRGVLRRIVPEWLTDSALRPFVVGFEAATRAHGGDGALYVRIRRRRGPV